MKNMKKLILAAILSGSTISSGYCMEDKEQKKTNSTVRFETETETISQIDRDQNGFSLLHWAAIMENKNFAEKLIAEGFYVNTRTSLGCTSLFLAAQRGREENVAFFISAGANVNMQNYKGHTPLHVAVWNDQINTLEALLRAGADFNISDKNGNSPLNDAIQHRHPEIAKIFNSFSLIQ